MSCLACFFRQLKDNSVPCSAGNRALSTIIFRAGLTSVQGAEKILGVMNILMNKQDFVPVDIL